MTCWSFHKLKSYGISDQILALFNLLSVIYGFALDGTSSVEYLVNAGYPEGSFRDGKMFLLYINEFLDNVIFNVAIYAGDTTLCSKCDQTYDLWQQLELASELESYLQDTVN